jgi:hypothetical protein
MTNANTTKRSKAFLLYSSRSQITSKPISSSFAVFVVSLLNFPISQGVLRGENPLI